MALGQRVEVDENVYQTASPAIGDVVIFSAPLDVEAAQPGDAATGAACAVPRPGPGPERYIKRIVAGAGDVISIARGFVVRNGSIELQITSPPATSALIRTSPRRSSSHHAPGICSATTGLSQSTVDGGDRSNAWIVGKLKLPALTPTAENEAAASSPRRTGA